MGHSHVQADASDTIIVHNRNSPLEDSLVCLPEGSGCLSLVSRLCGRGRHLTWSLHRWKSSRSRMESGTKAGREQPLQRLAVWWNVPWCVSTINPAHLSTSGTVSVNCCRRRALVELMHQVGSMATTSNVNIKKASSWTHSYNFTNNYQKQHQAEPKASISQVNIKNSTTLQSWLQPHR